MRAQKRGCFTRKTYDNYLYTWCPEKTVTKNIGGVGGKKFERFCNATANSNGEFVTNRSTGFTRRASINSHDWFGGVVNLNQKLKKFRNEIKK